LYPFIFISLTFSSFILCLAYQGVLDAFRVAEDVPLESKQVTDAIDKIQARVEEYYAGIREQVKRS
jgi:preprotein translocase subunit SecA